MTSVFAEQPTLAECLVDPEPPALLAPRVSPPLTAEAGAGVDLILEGFLLHHGRSRMLTVPEPGRRVLAGDFCYARGLVAVAASGDLYVIQALADLIALSAGLVAQESREDLPALWTLTVATITRSEPSLRDAAGVAARGLRGGETAALRALARTLDPIPELTEALS